PSSSTRTVASPMSNPIGRDSAAHAPHEPRRDDPQEREDRVAARNDALRATARAGGHDRVGDLLGLPDDPARRRVALERLLRESLGRDEARQDEADMDAVGALLEVQ